MTQDKLLTKTRERVLSLLREVPETRNSDLLLTWIYFKRFHNVEMPVLEWKQIQELEGRTESVRRMRAIIQNVDHEYPPTRPEVMKHRRQKEDDYHDFFAKYGRGA